MHKTLQLSASYLDYKEALSSSETSVFTQYTTGIPQDNINPTQAYVLAQIPLNFHISDYEIIIECKAQYTEKTISVDARLLSVNRKFPEKDINIKT